METGIVEIKDVKKVLKDTKIILKHNEALTIAKGEHFNMFSVLGIETKENKTHSAFLSELLNPKGSHKMGNVFLKLFMDVIQHNKQFKEEEDRCFNIERASVKVEKNIGPVKLYNKEGEYKSKATGGRIDIYLKDKKGNIISIENKIHAEDQEAQIQRYYNHKSDKNTVYYLTLKGEDPKADSCLKLKSGADFFNLSYRDDIIKWLELCLKEVPNFTGLRETINQYILLIKKLTHILNKEQQEPLNAIIVEHLEEAQYIADNYQNVLNTIRENFRKELKARLEEVLNPELFHVEVGKPIDQSYSQLWIFYKNRKEIPYSYGVESFSGRGNNNGAMFVGLFGYNGAKCESLPTPNKLNDFWQHYKALKTMTDDNNLHLNSKNLLRILYDSKPDVYESLVSYVVTQIVAFIKDTNKYVLLTDNKIPVEKIIKVD
ncbi:PDDEXK-like family protein [Lacinutrix undariae]